MTAKPLLIELSTEELPPKALFRLGDAFTQAVKKNLIAARLIDSDVSIQSICAPRHLGVLIASVAGTGEARQVRLKGPSVKVGLDDQGQPSLALSKWAEKQGVKIDQLTREQQGKQEHFMADRLIPGESLGKVIDDVISKSLAALPIPKLMQYQLADGHTTVSFVRPAHHLLVLHGNQIVPAKALGLDAGRETFGHRFLHKGPVVIAGADDYLTAMSAAHVDVVFDQRRSRIETQLRDQANTLQASLGNEAEFATLLDEVCGLVESPVVYVAQFDPEFLDVPPECLILTMRTDQKYFPLFDQQGKLTNRFLICSNMPIDDPSQIIHGNERVVRARLADAQFFFEQDKKRPLADRVAGLDAVVYHAKLGSQGERMTRVKALSAAIASMLGLSAEKQTECERAAMLAKTDLLTNMVGEFPELQGIMGSYYADQDGETGAVAHAMSEQYQPRFAGDAVPVSDCGTVLALADKLETLAGLFSIGQLPTGDKDPFALRRHALGITRILIEKKLPLSLASLLDTALAPVGAEADTVAKLNTFFYERLTGYLRDTGHSQSHVAAVLALRPDRLDQIAASLSAVKKFSELPQAQTLAAANKRISNILRKSSTDAGATPQPALYQDDAEHALAKATEDAARQVEQAIDSGDVNTAMLAIAQTSEQVDRFFDEVMVMADDPDVRANRLALLSMLHRTMNRVADISRLT